MEEDISRLLNEIGVWKEIERVCDEYLTNIDEKGSEYVSSSIVLPLNYEYSMFTKDFCKIKDYYCHVAYGCCKCIPDSLGQFLITNPLYYENVLRNVILKSVNTELEEMSRPFQVQFEQIHFVYRFENLPLMEKYKFYPTIQMSLSNFACIVAGRGEVKKYTRHTVWHCSRNCTPNVVANVAPICKSCFKEMTECVPLRDMSEFVKLIVFPLEMVQTPKCMGTMYHKFDVILRDDLAHFGVVYGNAYIITGKYDVFERAFYAWNIVECGDA